MRTLTRIAASAGALALVTGAIELLKGHVPVLSLAVLDRIIAPAPNGRGGGFTLKDVSWILAHAPAETIVLKPTPNGAQQAA